MTLGPGPALDGPALRSVIAFARERAHEGVTVADLADHAGYSPFHFTRLFSNSVRLPPGAFLTALRIDAAKRLLLAGDEAVIDVATAVGFDSLSSFSRRFASLVGVPPGQMRRLADKVADAPVRPFVLGDPRQPGVRVRFDVPDAHRPASRVQIYCGWFPKPVPAGLPGGGVLVDAAGEVEIPLCPGRPFLLANVMPLTADVEEQLAPTNRIVAVHPSPITAPCSVVLRFSPAFSTVPILTALPSLGLPDSAGSDKRRRLSAA